MICGCYDLIGIFTYINRAKLQRIKQRAAHEGLIDQTAECNGRRKKTAPEDRTWSRASPNSKRRGSVEPRYFRNAVAAPDTAKPPLAEPAHRCIMQRHFG